MGQKASDTRGITFEDVVVPAEVSTVSWSDSETCIQRDGQLGDMPVSLFLIRF